MSVRSRISAIKPVKAIAALLVLEILVFTLGAAPVHLAALESHHDCSICALIHHPPILSIAEPDGPGLPDIAGRLKAKSPRTAIAEPGIHAGPTRAPPSYLDCRLM